VDRRTPGSLARVDALISRVLRWGVLSAAAIIALGVVLFVAQGGAHAVLFSPFRTGPSWDADPRSLRAVLDELIAPQPAAVTDLGLLLLMITPVVSVAISPQSQTISVGDSAGAIAMEYNAQNQRLDGRTVTWTLSDSSVASVTQAAYSFILLRALKSGTVTLTATSEGVSGTSTVTVR